MVVRVRPPPQDDEISLPPPSREVSPGPSPPPSPPPGPPPNRQRSQKPASSSSRPRSPKAAPPPRQQTPPQDRLDLPPAYADVAGRSEISLATGEQNPSLHPRPPRSPRSPQPARSPGPARANVAPFQDDEADLDELDDVESVEDDEEDWALDDALVQDNGPGLPTYEQSEALQADETVDDLVRDTMSIVASGRRTHAGQPFTGHSLSHPVVLPQRRPEKRTRGFVRAYSPVLAASGIDQGTFLKFLNNLNKSIQACPVFPVVTMSTNLAASLPQITATSVAINFEAAAGYGPESFISPRMNNFLERMNDELFRPAGLYAMIVRYKPDMAINHAAVGSQSYASDSTRIEKIDITTHRAVVASGRSVADEIHPDDSASAVGRRSNSDAAGNSSAGAMQLIDAAPLMFQGDPRLAQQNHGVSPPVHGRGHSRDVNNSEQELAKHEKHLSLGSTSKEFLPNRGRAYSPPERLSRNRSRSSSSSSSSSSSTSSSSERGSSHHERHRHKSERRKAHALHKDTRRIMKGREPRHTSKRLGRFGDSYYDELQDHVMAQRIPRAVQTRVQKRLDDLTARHNLNPHPPLPYSASAASSSSLALSRQRTAERTAARAAEYAQRNAERASEQAQRNAERAAEYAQRNAERASEYAQRNAERASEYAQRNAGRAVERSQRAAARATEHAQRAVERATERAAARGDGRLRGRARLEAKIEQRRQQLSELGISYPSLTGEPRSNPTSRGVTAQGPWAKSPIPPSLATYDSSSSRDNLSLHANPGSSHQTSYPNEKRLSAPPPASPARSRAPSYSADQKVNPEYWNQADNLYAGAPAPSPGSAPVASAPPPALKPVVKRVMHEGVLYLMIYNMPSDAELIRAQALLVDAAQGGESEKRGWRREKA